MKIKKESKIVTTLTRHVKKTALVLGCQIKWYQDLSYNDLLK